MSGDFSATAYVSANTSSAANCSSSRWLTEEVFKLIDIVQSDEAIYNPRHRHYFCRPYVENFWREVDLKLEKNAGTSLAKWTNLRISFRREYTNYLEEKVPPCWSYFDRMYFLHPFLRKKQQQHKSLDTQVQDALVHLSNLSSRMQRERAGICGTSNSGQANNLNGPSSSPQPALDNYLEYFDEHDHNNPELEEILEDNGIKLECEEQMDEYEQNRHLHEPHSPNLLHHHANDEDDRDQEDNQLQKINYDAPEGLSPTSSVVCATTSTDKRLNQQQQQQMQHLKRLQLRAYQEDVHCKRLRLQEVQSTSGASSSGILALQPHSNISLVRPTFAKPVDIVSTTTAPAPGLVSTQHESEVSSVSVAAPTSTSFLPHSQRHASHMQQQQQPQQQQQQRLESANITTTGSNASLAVTAQASHTELCDCKTDPDAMFLMSLLPDIQKLNGRDRGKIKIAFQNILQDYLYPD